MVFPNWGICKPPPPTPLRNGQIFMKDAQCVEPNEKWTFWFLVFELWSILYSKFIRNGVILGTKMAISQKIKIAKIGKFIFRSFQHIPHLSCESGHIWRGRRRGLHILSWEISITFCFKLLLWNIIYCSIKTTFFLLLFVKTYFIKYHLLFIENFLQSLP